jgi:hypothetical protein
LVLVVCELFVAVSVKVTSAPGTIDPCGSETWPVTLPDEAVWALTIVTLALKQIPAKIPNTKNREALFILQVLLESKLAELHCCASDHQTQGCRRLMISSKLDLTQQ